MGVTQDGSRRTAGAGPAAGCYAPSRRPDELQSRASFVAQHLDALVNGRAPASLWRGTFGLACCAIGMSHYASSYDLDRFGRPVPRPSPRQSDVHDRRRPVCNKMARRWRTVTDQMAEPRWVDPMGSCGQWRRYYHLLVLGGARMRASCTSTSTCRAAPPTAEALFNASPDGREDKRQRVFAAMKRSPPIIWGPRTNRHDSGAQRTSPTSSHLPAGRGARQRLVHGSSSTCRAQPPWGAR